MKFRQKYIIPGHWWCPAPSRSWPQPPPWFSKHSSRCVCHVYRWQFSKHLDDELVQVGFHLNKNDGNSVSNRAHLPPPQLMFWSRIPHSHVLSVFSFFCWNLTASSHPHPRSSPQRGCRSRPSSLPWPPPRRRTTSWPLVYLIFIFWSLFLTTFLPCSWTD